MLGKSSLDQFGHHYSGLLTRDAPKGEFLAKTKQSETLGQGPHTKHIFLCVCVWFFPHVIVPFFYFVFIFLFIIAKMCFLLFCLSFQINK